MQHKNYITRYVDPITISEFYQITFVNVTRCIEFGRKFQWKCYYLIVVSIQIFIISLRSRKYWKQHSMHYFSFTF